MKYLGAVGCSSSMTIIFAGFFTVFAIPISSSWQGILSNQILTGFTVGFTALVLISLLSFSVFTLKERANETGIFNLFALIGVLGGIACGIAGLDMVYGQALTTTAMTVKLNGTLFGAIVSSITGAVSNEEIIEVFMSSGLRIGETFYTTITAWEMCFIPLICIATTILSIILYSLFSLAIPKKVTATPEDGDVRRRNIAAAMAGFGLQTPQPAEGSYYYDDFD